MADKKNPEQFEKSPLSSKKFIAYLIADIGWKILLTVMLFIYGDALAMLEWALMMGVIITSGFVQVGMLLGQASLDKYVRVAHINASLGIPTKLKGLKELEGEQATRSDGKEVWEEVSVDEG